LLGVEHPLLRHRVSSLGIGIVAGPDIAPDVLGLAEEEVVIVLRLLVLIGSISAPAGFGRLLPRAVDDCRPGSAARARARAAARRRAARPRRAERRGAADADPGTGATPAGARRRGRRAAGAEGAAACGTEPASAGETAGGRAVLGE